MMRTIAVTSTAFAENNPIPRKYTCDGEDLSPPLAWSGLPEGVKSLVLIVDDPDAPLGNWVHWVLFNMPISLSGVPEGVKIIPTMDIGIQGNNDFRKTGYNGPCPPKGKPHRYFFKLYALNTMLNLQEGASKTDVEKAMKDHVLASGQLIGTYGR